MMVTFLRGATSMGCAVAAVYFARFWRQSIDRFFLLFALAFFILAIQYLILGVVSFATEWQVYVFTLRLVAFALIIVAIVEKNRVQR
jgi:uncharacterized membrane-anchored protein YitT (DUF2179 family)